PADVALPAVARLQWSSTRQSSTPALWRQAHELTAWPPSPRPPKPHGPTPPRGLPLPFATAAEPIPAAPPAQRDTARWLPCAAASRAHPAQGPPAAARYTPTSSNDRFLALPCTPANVIINTGYELPPVPCHSFKDSASRRHHLHSLRFRARRKPPGAPNQTRESVRRLRRTSAGARHHRYRS